MRISQKVKGVIMRNLRNIIFVSKYGDIGRFHTCVSAPLNNDGLIKSADEHGELKTFYLHFPTRVPMATTNVAGW